MVESDFFQVREDQRKAYAAAFYRAHELLMGPGHRKGTPPKYRTVQKFLTDRMRDRKPTAGARGFRPVPTIYNVPPHIAAMWEGVQ